MSGSAVETLDFSDNVWINFSGQIWERFDDVRYELWPVFPANWDGEAERDFFKLRVPVCFLEMLDVDQLVYHICFDVFRDSSCPTVNVLSVFVVALVPESNVKIQVQAVEMFFGRVVHWQKSKMIALFYASQTDAFFRRKLR